MKAQTPRYQCVINPNCPGNHISKYDCCKDGPGLTKSTIEVADQSAISPDAWMIWYSDVDVSPDHFSGKNAEEAARNRFSQAKDHWTVRLFKCVEQSGSTENTAEISHDITSDAAHAEYWRMLYEKERNKKDTWYASYCALRDTPPQKVDDESYQVFSELDKARRIIYNFAAHNPKYLYGDIEKDPLDAHAWLDRNKNEIGAAPIVKIKVHDGEIVDASFYSPSLPDGEHDLFCVPVSKSGEWKPHPNEVMRIENEELEQSRRWYASHANSWRTATQPPSMDIFEEVRKLREKVASIPAFYEGHDAHCLARAAESPGIGCDCGGIRDKNHPTICNNGHEAIVHFWSSCPMCIDKNTTKDDSHATPECSSLCHPDESCIITDDGKCDARNSARLSPKQASNYLRGIKDNVFVNYDTLKHIADIIESLERANTSMVTPPQDTLKINSAIDVGDVVKHVPTNQYWVVAYVRDDRIGRCGWPQYEDALRDCTLINKATHEQRENTLRIQAKMESEMNMLDKHRKRKIGLDMHLTAMCTWAEALAEIAGWKRETSSGAFNEECFWRSYDAAREAIKKESVLKG